MGKKKKDKGVKKERKSRANVDERLKQIGQISLPEEQPYKKDNDSLIEGFFRFRKKNPEKTNVKIKYQV